MKLFEIPVYALTREQLNRRVDEERNRIKKSFIGNSVASEEHISKCMGLFTFPQCLWEYNHIVGYIVVGIERADVIIKWYAELPRTEKYYWKSRKKMFFQDMQLNGYHFYIGNIKNGDEFREKLHSFVEGFTNELKNRRYYADLEAFNNLVDLLDYSRLLSESNM